MSSNEDQIQQIDANIRESKEVLEFSDALARLQSNRDFKKVILQGYFNQEAVRLVHLKSDANMQSAESQKSILAQIDAIGALSQYLRATRQQGDMARKTLAYAEQVREEMIQEDADGV